MINPIIHFFKKLLFVFWLLGIALIGAWIAVENPQPLALSLPFFTLPMLSMGVYLCVVLALGVILGFLTSYLAISTKLYFVSKKLKQANNKVNALKSSQSSEPLKLDKPAK